MAQQHTQRSRRWLITTCDGGRQELEGRLAIRDGVAFVLQSLSGESEMPVGAFGLAQLVSAVAIDGTDDRTAGRP